MELLKNLGVKIDMISASWEVLDSDVKPTPKKLVKARKMSNIQHFGLISGRVVNVGGKAVKGGVMELRGCGAARRTTLTYEGGFSFYGLDYRFTKNDMGKNVQKYSATTYIHALSQLLKNIPARLSVKDRVNSPLASGQSRPDHRRRPRRGCLCLGLSQTLVYIQAF